MLRLVGLVYFWQMSQLRMYFNVTFADLDWAQAGNETYYTENEMSNLFLHRHNIHWNGKSY